MYKIIDKVGSIVVIIILGMFILFVAWASYFNIDQVARTSGQIIASSRVQVIQSVDGGVISQIYVKEGDRVSAGQVIAKLDQTRIGAAVKEIEARLAALKIRALRLRAEVKDELNLQFSDVLLEYPELINVEEALFEQRQEGYKEELATLKEAISLAQEELELVQKMSLSGDSQASEILNAKKALNSAKSKKTNHVNKYYEDARAELASIEDEIAQNEQVLTQRRQQLSDSVFITQRDGIVKNVRVTTVGGVLRAGEELMQIIPIDDDLIIEAKISPVDISMVRTGQSAVIRFDPFDYTIFGSGVGKVTYVSSDTIKEESSRGEEVYYMAHIILDKHPTVTTAGHELDILPGMTVQVDIKSGERSLLTYLLKPLRKTLAESFGER